MFVNISYLTLSMVDYIDAPIPYIVGMSKDIWKKVKKEKKELLTTDIAIYDIDKRKFKFNEALPTFPEESMSYVYEMMNKIITYNDQNKSVWKNVIIGRVLDEIYFRAENRLL